MDHATTINDPIYRHDLGPHLMTIEILPAEIPRDASEHFAKALKPYIKGLVQAHRRGGTLALDSNLGEEEHKVLATLDRATIADNGVLRPQHAWLMERVDAYWAEHRYKLPKPNTATPDGTTISKGSGESSTLKLNGASQSVKPKKRVLLLGSGMVAKPAVDVFLGREDIRLVVGK